MSFLFGTAGKCWARRRRIWQASAAAISTANAAAAAATTRVLARRCRQVCSYPPGFRGTVMSFLFGTAGKCWARRRRIWANVGEDGADGTLSGATGRRKRGHGGQGGVGGGGAGGAGGDGGAGSSALGSGGNGGRGDAANVGEDGADGTLSGATGRRKRGHGGQGGVGGGGDIVIQIRAGVLRPRAVGETLAQTRCSGHRPSHSSMPPHGNTAISSIQPGFYRMRTGRLSDIVIQIRAGVLRPRAVGETLAQTRCSGHRPSHSAMASVELPANKCCQNLRFVGSPTSCSRWLPLRPGGTVAARRIASHLPALAADVGASPVVARWHRWNCRPTSVVRTCDSWDLRRRALGGCLSDLQSVSTISVNKKPAGSVPSPTRYLPHAIPR